MRLGLKGLTLLLLLVSLILGSSVDARSGKHWRQNKAPSTSLLRRKGKPKSSSSPRQNGKGNQNPYQPSPSTTPNVPVSPSGSPVQGKGGQSPTMPAPSGGTGYTLPSPPMPQPPPPPSPPPPPQPAAAQNTIFNVVDFGAKGDGVTDDTQALRFYGSSNVTVTGIAIVNSSQCHLKFDSCQGVMVHDLTISSPENSPNTDGIHRLRSHRRQRRRRRRNSS